MDSCAGGHGNCAAAGVAHAGNPSYRCEPQTVQDDAVAVVYSDVDVSSFPDPDKHTASSPSARPRSGGASRRSRPSPEILQQLRNGDVSEIIVRLTLARAARPARHQRDFRAAQRRALPDSAAEIGNCLTALSLFASPDAPKPKVIIGRDPNYPNGRESVYLSIKDKELEVTCSVSPAGSEGRVSSEFTYDAAPVCVRAGALTIAGLSPVVRSLRNKARNNVGDGAKDISRKSFLA